MIEGAIFTSSIPTLSTLPTFVALSSDITSYVLMTTISTTFDKHADGTSPPKGRTLPSGILPYASRHLRHSVGPGDIGLLTLQDLMRHRTLTQTLQYVRLYEEDKQQDYHQVMDKIQSQHPLERRFR